MTKMLLLYQSICNMYLAKIKSNLVFYLLQSFDQKQFLDLNKGWLLSARKDGYGQIFAIFVTPIAFFAD